MKEKRNENLTRYGNSAKYGLEKQLKQISVLKIIRIKLI